MRVQRGWWCRSRVAPQARLVAGERGNNAWTKIANCDVADNGNLPLVLGAPHVRGEILDLTDHAVSEGLRLFWIKACPALKLEMPGDGFAACNTAEQ